MNKTSFKITLIGNGGVGKTTFMKYIKNGVFDNKYLSTIGVEVHTLPNIATINGEPVTFVCWDTAGQEKFCGLGEGYYIQSDLCLSFCSLDSENSLNSIYNWELFFRRVCPNTPIIRVANKSDIFRSDLAKYTSGINAHYISVKLGTCVDNLLVHICKTLGVKINRNIISEGKYISAQPLSTPHHSIEVNNDNDGNDDNDNLSNKKDKCSIVLLKLNDNLDEYEQEVLCAAEDFGVPVFTVTDKNVTVNNLISE